VEFRRSQIGTTVMTNGGIIGPKNKTSLAKTSGIWNISEQYTAQKNNRWNTGISLNGLALWLDAGNIDSYPGSGNTWFDLSGNNRNFNWVASPSFTTGSIPYFSTLGNRCVGPASNSFGITNTSGYTLFLIFLQNSLVETSAFKFYSSDSGGRGIFSHATWSDDNIYFDQGGCCAADTRTSVGSGGVTTWTILTYQRDTNGSTRRIYKNGSILATNTSAAANINLTSTAVDLGSSDEFGGNSSTWNARLGGVLVYNRGLSQSEISSNFDVIRGRYGI
jgi:hypothetical protein